MDEKPLWRARCERSLLATTILKYCIDMVDTDAFHSDVIAYPAIVIISREKPDATRVAFRPTISARELRALALVQC